MVEVSFSASTVGAAAAAAAVKASEAEPEDATMRLPAALAQEPLAKKAKKKQPDTEAGLRHRHHRRPSRD